MDKLTGIILRSVSKDGKMVLLEVELQPSKEIRKIHVNPFEEATDAVTVLEKFMKDLLTEMQAQDNLIEKFTPYIGREVV